VSQLAETQPERFLAPFREGAKQKMLVYSIAIPSALKVVAIVQFGKF
jgi:hypothetical protein